LADRQLFRPSDLPLRADYPELDTIEEFSILTDRELLLTWGWANTTSPYFGIKNIKVKANRIATDLFGGKIGLTDIKNWELGRFSDNVKVAMDRMMKFSSSDRHRAKCIVERIFDTYESIVGVNVEDLLDDMDKQKKYIDNTQNIVASLPLLIKHKEEGFGYKRDKSKKEGKTMNLMDSVMSNDEVETEEEM
jgi:hypothetical protein